MNREIKFRAWKESEKRMVGWGELLCRDGSSLLGDVLTGVYLKAVMQYTGLKDKNGKEIYESDIVIYDAAKEAGYPKLERNVVIWYRDSFQLSMYSANWYDWSEMEIIGNIYENPELMP